MKTTYLFVLISVLSFSIKGQTTFTYSGNSTIIYNDEPSKIGGIGQSFSVTNTTFSHIGLMGISKNATDFNIGVLGTTQLNTNANNSRYYAVVGDNFSNFLAADNTDVVGGYFRATNSGTNGRVIGVTADVIGLNNSTTTFGVNANVSNASNLTPNKTIAVSGVTFSGKSTVSNYLKGIANPGGYFSSNDGQGIYATTTGYHNIPGGSNKASQAITGYSNQPSVYLNAGTVGYAEGTGNFKFGTYGYVNGTAATQVSAGICGQDAIGATNSYAGYFYGKVGMTGSLSVSSTGTFTGCVTASNLTCPSDSRYKKNIIPLENSLFNILKINGVRYDWKQQEFPEKNFSEKNQIGFIAQDLEKIFPEMVFTDEKGFKSVDYARLTPVLVEAIKELTLKNQNLESRLDKMEAMLSASTPSNGK